MPFLVRKTQPITSSPAGPSGGSPFDSYLAAEGLLATATPDTYRGQPSTGGQPYSPPRPNPPPAAIDSSARICGARCGNTWVMPWKSRSRPIFEEEWSCSSKCLHKLIAAAVRRETGDGIDDGEQLPHRHRVPLGLVMLAQGWITHPQLQSALKEQRSSGHGRIGDWLVHSCGLDQQRVTRALGMQWNCPVFTTEGFTPAAMALVMPKRFLTEFGLVPLRTVGRRLLYVASDGTMDAAAALAIEQMSGLKVETGLLDDANVTEARASVLAAESVPVLVASVPDTEALTARIARKIEQAMPIASRVVRVHQYFWLRTWLESGAFSGNGTLPSGRNDVQDYLFTIGGR